MAETRPFVTVVTGVPRSGTSLMMQMLAAGGVPPLCDEARPPDRHNERGYYEYAPVKQLVAGQTPAWLPQARGHAVKVIHALVPRLPDRGDYRVVWMRRSLPAVLASQRAMCPPDPRQDDAPLAATLTAQLVELESWLTTCAAGHWLRVDYEALCDEPAGTVQAIGSLLGGGLDEAAMLRAVDPRLCHQG